MGEVNDSNLYVSLDEAREELKKRWNDVELRKRVEEELGENFWPSFKIGPRGMLGRALISPDNGFVFFLCCTHYIDVAPIGIEYLGDKFFTINEEKKGLGRLCFCTNEGIETFIDLIDYKLNEGKLISNVEIKTGEKLVDFHHKLLKHSGYDIELFDITKWAHNIGKSKEYYFYYLSHFVTHGVFFETFILEDYENENKFVNEVILPAITKIEQIFGLRPLIVKLYPDNQSESENFYWWSYPPNINNYLIEYAKKNNLLLKKMLL